MKYRLQGLDCANCAAKVERALHHEGFDGARVNFATGSVVLDPQWEAKAQRVIDRVEPGLRLVPIEERVDPRSRLLLGRISLSVVLLILGFFLSYPYREGTFLLTYLLIGGDVVWRAIRNLMAGKVFDEHFLMSLATIGAIAVGELPEAVAVMLFYAVGEFFQGLAVQKARRSIADLIDLRPETAHLLVDGVNHSLTPDEVRVGDLIEVRPGEKIPLDGRVVTGVSSADTSALTGESVPRSLSEGDQVLAGFINGSGLLRVRVEKEFSQSAVAKMLELVESASTHKAPTERFITSFARWYTPVVVLGALGVALGPPLLVGAEFGHWIYRALILLVISCPCALVVSIPMSYFGGIGGASKAGILVKGANYLDALTQVETVVFDKTGTLTEGKFKVSEIIPHNGYTPEEILHWAALAEVHSTHPIAKSILQAYGRPISQATIQEVQEIQGHGVRVWARGRKVLVGNDRFLRREGIARETGHIPGTVVFVAIDQVLAGSILIADQVRPEAKAAIDRLREMGVRQTVMLTGDDREIAEQVAAKVGIDQVYAELLPQEKVEQLKEIQARQGGKVVFVGDGINDAPVIMASDIGVAMGGLGSDAAIEAADVVLMEDDPTKLAQAIRIARLTRRVVWQNIALAFGVKAVFVLLGVMGLASMWEAVFADVGVALLAVINARRTINLK